MPDFNILKSGIIDYSYYQKKIYLFNTVANDFLKLNN